MQIDQMESMLTQLSQGFYIRQVAVIISLYLLGMITLYAYRDRLECLTRTLLAFPIGLALWCIGSFILLTIGIPFRLLTIILLIVCFEVVLYAVLRHKERLVFSREIVIGVLKQELVGLLIVGVIACISVSGLFSVSVSNDTMYYYMYYPEVITQNGQYLPSYDVFLSDVGPLATMIGTLAAMFGFDQTYGIQMFFTIDFIVVFATAVYDQAKGPLGKKAYLASAVSTAILVSATPFVVISKWILANVYVMFYSFILLYLAHKLSKEGKKCLIILSVLVSMISMLRMEGGIVACFMIVCISTLDYKKDELLTYLMLPTILIPGLYYYLYFARFDVHPLYSFLTWPKALLLVVLMSALAGYLIVLRENLSLIFLRRIRKLILLALCVGNLCLLMIAPRDYIMAVKAFAENFLYQQGWGYAIILAVMAFIFLLLLEEKTGWSKQYRPDIEYEELIVWGYILVTIAVSYARGGGLRCGIGDSGNRVMLQIIPFLVYALTCKTIRILSNQKKKEA
ncbi:MAG: hypothetical protein GX567_07695 [Clostridia bacterium]|nr:hypothetical protein [Clostridia bacterium]